MLTHTFIMFFYTSTPQHDLQVLVPMFTTNRGGPYHSFNTFKEISRGLQMLASQTQQQNVPSKP